MRINELLESEEELADWAATASLCKSSKSDSAIGASALASCKSQGLRKRTHKRKFKIKAGEPRQSVVQKKIKGKKYGGPLPFYGSGSKGRGKSKKE